VKRGNEVKKSHTTERQTQDFDWEKARQRIAAAQATLAELDEASPEMLQKVWAQRAVKLAQRTDQEGKDERIELLMIQLGREVYGLEVQYVFDIRPAARITHVPRVPEWVTGVTNRRGHILSVLDLRRFFGLAPQAQGHDDETEHVETTPYLVFVETPEIEASAALLVDGAPAIEMLSLSRVQAASDTPQGLHPEYVRGVVEYGDEHKQIAVVLDLLALMKDERLIIHEEIT
jgi:purine-binding chemotaxis protein CheW